MWWQPINQGCVVFVVHLIIQKMHVPLSNKQNMQLMCLPCNLDSHSDLNNNNIILTSTPINLVGEIIQTWGMVLVHNNSRHNNNNYSDSNNTNPPPANTKLPHSDNNNSSNSLHLRLHNMCKIFLDLPWRSRWSKWQPTTFSFNRMWVPPSKTCRLTLDNYLQLSTIQIKWLTFNYVIIIYHPCFPRQPHI